MAVWSMLAAPLLAGTDIARADPATLALLGDRALIALDQDPAGRPPTVDLDAASGRLVLRRALADGSTAVSVTALGDTGVTVPAGVSRPGPRGRRHGRARSRRRSARHRRGALNRDRPDQHEFR